MEAHWVSPQKAPRIELARPEIEVNRTCSVVILSLAECHRPDHVDLFHDLEEIALAAYFRQASLGDVRRLFVIPREKESTEMWNRIKDAFGEPVFFEKVC